MIQAKIDGESVTVGTELIEKYSRPGPRYTSYPTAPNWSKSFGPGELAAAIKKSNASGRPPSLYFHIPFCEERCTFCACSVVATRKREVVVPYLKALTGEIRAVSSLIDRNRAVEQIHWGGGTPTYLDGDQIQTLYETLARHFQIAPNAEISIEIDPRVTTDEHLKTLRRLGFNRVSLGVQDLDVEVQEGAGRIQPEEITRRTIEMSRELQFDSINVDLVYGLPKQTPAGFSKTLQKVVTLNPGRIALFNFAYVPWMHPHHRKINPNDLPPPVEKLKMFCKAVEIFQDAGYAFIGLDHFAKQTDELAQAQREGTMYRNFQGYTTKANCDLIGMGVTAISSVENCFAQNAKKLKDYEETDFSKTLATRCGLQLSEDDRLRQKVIREIFCHQKAGWRGFHKQFQKEQTALQTLADDGLLELSSDGVQVSALGRLFLRNIGMVFDAYLQPGNTKFSKTV